LGGKKMIRGIITLTIIWVALAFAWEPFTSTVEKTQAVDKTKEIVYNVFNNVKEKVKEDE
tara:strand:- start:865 stop:1044 length:180 start_codon:yes stop_codon:yes gene_type:complete